MRLQLGNNNRCDIYSGASVVIVVAAIYLRPDYWSLLSESFSILFIDMP